MLRPTIAPRAGRSLLRNPRRFLHQVPLLQHEYKHGVGPKDDLFMSAGGFEVAWTQYQGLMVEKLNALTAGGEWESRTAKDILLKHAREPQSAPIFNYASMAHNNHLFFEALSPTGVPMSPQLKKSLEDSFSSIDTLQREMVLTASSMFGPGFVWIVQAKTGEFSLLTTYLAGTPYPAAHYRQQPVDMNTEDSSVSEHIRRINRAPPVNGLGAFGPSSGDKRKLGPGGADITPVLCVNTWEHVYLPDYGVKNKRRFVENWWRKIDWNIVASRSTLGMRSGADKFIH
ncbi:superoxide dismutase [Amylocarpus encephaloides]|uniref:Superoxide dismutase n=1 Tax=Amylocarpus encephaloides TaxID=45428 RepID=A0A9P8C889_9HELO|nr:superoxide dismutase [Amylocarpus encephaloides]